MAMIASDQTADLRNEAKHHLNKTTNTIILDYLLWLSAKTILEEAQECISPEDSRSRGRRLVGLVDGLIHTFDTTNQPKFLYPLLTRRVHLSALAILFLDRDTQCIIKGPHESSTLRDMRRTSRVRRYLRENNAKSVLKAADLYTAMVALPVVTTPIKHAAITTFGTSYSTSPPAHKPGLMDALELFLAVSASSYGASDAFPNETWIEIACHFMLIATIEAYLIDERTGLDAVNQAFSYGALNNPDTGSADVDALFREATSNEAGRAKFLRAWEKHRQRTLARLRSPDEGLDLHEHWLQVLEAIDVSEFKLSVVDFLVQVLRDMPEPELVKYGNESSELPKSVLRAPGMIAISHDCDERPRKTTRLT